MKNNRTEWGLCAAIMPLVLLLTLFTGCKSEQKRCIDCPHEVYVPLLEDDITEYPIVSQLFGSIDTVYLENAGPGSYVASVDEVKFIGDTIIVRSESTLYFFNRQGKFISRFYRQGNGSGNYRSISSFDLLPSAGEMIILDNQSDALFVYGLDGTYKRSVYLEDNVTDFAVLPGGDYLFTNPIKYSNKPYRRGLWRVDAAGRFKEQLIAFDDDFLHVSINNPYLSHISPDKIGFMRIEDTDQFYHIEGDSIYTTCRMTTDIVIPDELKGSDKVFVNPQKEYTKCGYLETERFLFFVSTNYGANLVMALVDKDDWTTYRMYVYTEDFNMNAANVEQFPYLVGCYNGSMVGFFDAGMVYQEERFRKMFPAMKPDSNPVLIFYNDK